MVRSTQTSPAPTSTSPQRTDLRRLSRRIAVSESESGDDDQQVSSFPNGPRQLLRRTPRFASVSADSDEDMHYDMHSIHSDASLVSEDEAYLSEIAAATQINQPTLSQQLRTAGDNNAKIFAQLLDPVKRNDMLMKQFHDFVPHSLRQTLKVPKRAGKDFNKDRSHKFIAMVCKTNEVDNDVLLEAFEEFLADLMDCFDHPYEVIGWNPFAAFAQFVQAGAAHRHPHVLQSCSRLTLGADWGQLSEEDERRIGDNFLWRLTRLHLYRMARVNEVLTIWHDKFRRHSTCDTCNTDPWETFLLTTIVAMLKEGTKYIDIETASDTSSEADSDHDDDEVMDDTDDGYDDDHRQETSDSEDSDADVAALLDVSAPRLTHIDDTQEPPQRPAMGLVPRQSFLRNYGPNAYILRVITVDQIGCVEFSRSAFKVCPNCGYRFDGHDADKASMFYQAQERAFEEAREQISEIQEMIDMPRR